MSPLEINETSDPTGPDASPSGRRASLKGFWRLEDFDRLRIGMARTLQFTGIRVRIPPIGLKSLPSLARVCRLKYTR